MANGNADVLSAFAGETPALLVSSTMRSVDWLASPGGSLRGEISVPGDKSISHRAVMLAAIAEGASHITGFLEAEDTQATVRIFKQLGVRIESPNLGEKIVHGVGLHGLRSSTDPLDCGNSGTSMRLMAGLLAGQPFTSTLIGDVSLSKRPMARVIEPLCRMGAAIETALGELPPLIIHANKSLKSIDYKGIIASAQVKSALLLAGLYARGETRVVEPHPTRNYTERMLQVFGWPIEFSSGQASLKGGQHRLVATDLAIPTDFSSAAFFLVAGTVIPGSELLIRRVGINPRRTGLLRVLQLMGARIREENVSAQAGERVADLRVHYAPLHGIVVPENLVPDMIDEFPALFVAAALAMGQTQVTGAAELRVKESDRITTMVQALRQLGASIAETPDGALIQGGALQGGNVDSHGDHRIAMSLTIAAQRASAQVRISNCANVATSFPGFVDLAASVGFELRETGVV